MLFINNVTKKHAVIIFDGLCNLCNNKINFVIRNDKKIISALHHCNQKLVKSNWLNTISINTILIRFFYWRITKPTNNRRRLYELLKTGWVVANFVCANNYPRFYEKCNLQYHRQKSLQMVGEKRFLHGS